MVIFKIYYLMFVKVDKYFQMGTLNASYIRSEGNFHANRHYCIKRIYIVVKFRYHYQMIDKRFIRVTANSTK